MTSIQYRLDAHIYRSTEMMLMMDRYVFQATEFDLINRYQEDDGEANTILREFKQSRSNRDERVS